MRVKVIALSCFVLAVGCKSATQRAPALSLEDAADVINKSQAFTATSENRPLGLREPRAHVSMQAVYALGAKGYLDCTGAGQMIPTKAGVVFIQWPPPPTEPQTIGSCTPTNRFGFSDVTFSLNPCPRKLIAVTKVSSGALSRAVDFTWTWDISGFPLDARTVMFGPTGEYPTKTAEVTFTSSAGVWQAQFGPKWEE